MPEIIFIDLTGPAKGSAYVLDKGTGKVRSTLEFDEIGALGPIEAAKGSEACLSLPLSMLDFRRVSLPVADPDKVRRLLPFELEGLMLQDPGRAVIDAVVLGTSKEDPSRHDVLAVYMDAQVLGAVLAALARHGIDPRVACSIELSAALEEYGRLGGEPEAVLMNFGGLTEGRTMRAWQEAVSGGRINLRRGPLGYTADERRTRKSLALAAVLAILMLATLGADIGLRIKAERGRERTMEDAVKSAYASAFPQEKYSGPQGISYKLQARIKELEARVRNLKGLRPLDLMAGLQPPKGLSYTEIALEADGVTLSGKAGSMPTVQAAQAALGGTLDDVKITETTPAGDAVKFTMTGRRKP